MSDSVQIKNIRERLDLTQAQMTKLLGINRSYLAELESGRRPMQDWILAKAREVERRMKGAKFSKPDSDSDPRGFAEFVETVSALSHDELLELSQHLHVVMNDAPNSASLLYQNAIAVVLAEFRARLRSAKRTKK